MNRHRKAVYAMRREILHSSDISKRIKIFASDEVHNLAISPQATTDQFEDMIREVFPFDEKTLDKIFETAADKFESVLKKEADKLYEAKADTFGKDVLRKIERDIYLQVLDNLWMQHLENMDHLREGIHWISVGQQDPLVEYRRRGQMLFEDMQNSLRHDTLMHIFHAQPITEEYLERSVETDLTRAARGSISNASAIQAEETEFQAEDFSAKRETQQIKKQKQASIKKARKSERKRKTAAKRRRK
jgi:preprotein translocase subunit SecA